jgi:hypothetical protein
LFRTVSDRHRSLSELADPTQDGFNSNGRANRALFGEQTTFIGQESRQRIQREIEGPQAPLWVQYGRYMRDADGQDISDWRDIATVARLYSERDAVCNHIVGQMVELAAKMSKLDIDTT